MGKILRLLAVGSVIALTAVGCGPSPAPALTDSLDLGALGVFAEPALDVTATTMFDYSPRGPVSTVLVVTARDRGGNAVRTFTMREDNVFDKVSEVGVGEFPGMFAPPHLRRFSLSGGPGVPEVSTVVGNVSISELVTGRFYSGVNGGTYEVTRLRASFSGVYGAYGVVAGYFTIG